MNFLYETRKSDVTNCSVYYFPKSDTPSRGGSLVRPLVVVAPGAGPPTSDAGADAAAEQAQAAASALAFARAPRKGGTAELAVSALKQQVRRASEQGDAFTSSFKDEWAAELEGEL